MILNIKQLIFEQLSQIDETTNSHHDEMIENINLSNMNVNPNNTIHGDCILTEDGTLIFKVNDEFYMIEFNEDVSILDINDYIYGKVIVLEQYNPIKTDLLTNYTGGGSISELSGISFEFETPGLDGKYFLEERANMSSSVKMTRII